VKQERAKQESAGSAEDEWVVPGGSCGVVDADCMGEEGSDTSSSLSHAGSLTGAQVNALFSHHWVKNQLHSDSESDTERLPGFMHYLIWYGRM
jgi:hypothetical protein